MRNFKKKIFILIALLMIGGAIAVIILNGGKAKGTVTSGTEEYAGNVSELYLEIGACQVEIKNGPAAQATVQYEGVQEKYFSCSLKDGKLKVKYIQKNATNFSLFGIHLGNSETENSKIIVTIPEDAVLEKCVMELGATQVKGKQIMAEELVVSVGVGDLNIEELFAGKSADIDVGVGQITVDYAELTNASLDCGTGEIEMKGKLLGKSDIDCGVGKVKIALTTKEEEYRGELDCGLGKISFGGITLKSGDRDFGDAAAENRMDIDCGIGNVSVTFEE